MQFEAVETMEGAKWESRIFRDARPASGCAALLRGGAGGGEMGYF